MDGFRKLPRDTQVVLGGAVVYIVVSLLDWQQRAIGGFTVRQSEWAGIGVAAGTLSFALLVWELGRALDAQFATRPGASNARISFLLAVLLALLTLITFLEHGIARHWPAWLGLLVSLVIAGVACVRARREGVQLPTRTA